MQLANMCPAMHGGVDKYEKKVEEVDKKRVDEIEAKNKDMLQILSSDGWKLYRKLDGLGRTWHHMAPLDPQFS